MFTDQYLGNVTVWPSFRIPFGWQLCQGQLLSVFDNVALFTLLGKRYGGDGIATFALPDLRGRIAIHAGQGATLPNNYFLGQTGGGPAVGLTTANLAPHTHNITTPNNSGLSVFPVGYTAQGTLSTPVNNFPAATSSPLYANVANANMTGNATGHSPSSNDVGPAMPTISPYCVLNYIICTNGLFPEIP